MSSSRQETVRCPCGIEMEVFVAESINAGRHPKLRQALLDGELHRFPCEACGHAVILEEQLLYVDAERRQFFVVMPRNELLREEEAIALTRQLFDTSFGPQMPAALQEIGAGMMVRLCFGLPALRDKVLADEAGLNDLALEALKCEVMGQLPELEHRATSALWLLRAGGNELELVAETDGTPLPVVVPRRSYEVIAALGDEELLRLRSALVRGPHVSMLRLGLAA